MYYVLCNPLYEAERLRFLETHLPSRGIPWSSIEVVYGPWGSEITSKDYFSIYDPFVSLFGQARTMTFKTTCLSKGEISLLLGFSRFLDHALASKHEYVVLFESDIYLRPDFSSRLESVLEEIRGTSWDMVSLSEGVGTRPPGMQSRSYFASQKTVPAPHWMVFRCCDATLFHRRFLENLRKTFLPARECLDWWLNLQANIHRASAFWTDPPLAEQGTNRHRCLTNLPA